MTVPIRSAATATGPSWRVGSGPVLVIAVVAVVTVDLGATLLAGRLERVPALVLTFFASLAALVAAGVISGRVPGQQSNARLMLVIAGVTSAIDLLGVRPDIGPSAFLGGIAAPCSTTLFGQLLLRWPGPRVTSRAGRAVLALGYVALPVMTLAWQLRWDPRWFGRAAAGWWWPAVAPDRDLAFQIFLASQLAAVALILAFVGLVTTRVVRTPRRTALLPVGAAAVLLAAATLVGVAQGLGVAVPAGSDILQNVALLAVPAAVLIGTAVGGTAAGGARSRFDPSDRRPGSTAIAAAPRPAVTHPALGAARAAFIAALLLIAVVFGARSVAAGVAGRPVPTPQPLPAPVAPGP